MGFNGRLRLCGLSAVHVRFSRAHAEHAAIAGDAEESLGAAAWTALCTVCADCAQRRRVWYNFPCTPL